MLNFFFFFIFSCNIFKKAIIEWAQFPMIKKKEVNRFKISSFGNAEIYRLLAWIHKRVESAHWDINPNLNPKYKSILDIVGCY